MTFASTWTDAEDGQLRALWAVPGATAATIAPQIGRTRAAVCGRSFRLGLSENESWPAEKVEQLAAFAAQGLSSGETAKRLGVTKNTALSKANRIGVKFQSRNLTQRVAKPQGPGQGSSSAAVHQVQRATSKIRVGSDGRRTYPLQPDQPLPPEPDIDQAFKHLVDLGPNDCHWPVGHPHEPGFGFCAAQIVPDRPYCPEHCRRAYVGTVREAMAPKPRRHLRTQPPTFADFERKAAQG